MNSNNLNAKAIKRRDFVRTSSVIAAGSLLGGWLAPLAAAPASGGVSNDPFAVFQEPLAVSNAPFAVF